MILVQFVGIQITVSSFWLQKEQSLVSLSLKMQRCLFWYKALFSALYWKTRNVVLIVTIWERKHASFHVKDWFGIFKIGIVFLSDIERDKGHSLWAFKWCKFACFLLNGGLSIKDFDSSFNSLNNMQLVLVIKALLQNIVWTSQMGQSGLHNFFSMIIFTQNMKAKKLNKNHMKIQRTQLSLLTSAHNEGFTRRKYFEIY